jgi:hypothetical protein
MRKILIPSSLTVESKDKRIKAYKIGQIARAAAIFGVNEILIYLDRFDDSRYIELILKYMETPQYLRKRLFPLRKELKYVGILPPLRTAHHPINSSSKNLMIGEFREGMIVESEKKTLVDIGVECLAELRGKDTKNERITTIITSKRPLVVEEVDRVDRPENWGYETRITDTLGKTLKMLESMIIFTSRKGKVLDEDELRRLTRMKDIAFVFGSPERGVDLILKDENLSMDDFSDWVINTIPDQYTETVRTEEAIFATLAIFNMLMR